VYAETPDGLVVSHDHAATFKNISGEKALGDFFIHPLQPKIMFSARAADGLFKSIDGGISWQKLPVQIKGPTRFAKAGDGSIWMSDPGTGTVRSIDEGRTWELIWDVFGAIDYDPWNAHSMYMATHGGIWWVHPKDIQRKEISYAYKAIDEGKKVVLFNNTVFADHSNTTYKLTQDIILKGKVHDLIMMPRGLKNVVFDGQGHSVTTTISNAIFGDDMENVIIENFHFIQPLPGERNPVIYLTNSRNLTIRNCTFEVSPDFDAGKNGAGPAIETRGIFTKNVLIENCIFKTPGRSPVIYGNGSHTIRNSTFTGERINNIQLVEAEGSVVEENNKVDLNTVHIILSK
jgi:hypothetical protein